MRVEQSFVIPRPPEDVWRFFEDIPGVARCVPGMESVEVVDGDTTNVRVRQSLGPMSATFDLRMRVTERTPVDRMRFTAVGKAVRGAAGSLRSVNTVVLSPEGPGTKVSLEADVALGGMLGSVGQKIVTKQATAITEQFAAALEGALSGQRIAADVSPPAAARAVPAVGPAPAVTPMRWTADPRITGLAGLCLGLALALVVALVGRRRCP